MHSIHIVLLVMKVLELFEKADVGALAWVVEVGTQVSFVARFDWNKTEKDFAETLESPPRALFHRLFIRSEQSALFVFESLHL